MVPQQSLQGRRLWHQNVETCQKILQSVAVSCRLLGEQTVEPKSLDEKMVACDRQHVTPMHPPQRSTAHPSSISYLPQSVVQGSDAIA